MSQLDKFLTMDKKTRRLNRSWDVEWATAAFRSLPEILERLDAAEKQVEELKSRVENRGAKLGANIGANRIEAHMDFISDVARGKMASPELIWRKACEIYYGCVPTNSYPYAPSRSEDTATQLAEAKIKIEWLERDKEQKELMTKGLVTGLVEDRQNVEAKYAILVEAVRKYVASSRYEENFPPQKRLADLVAEGKVDSEINEFVARANEGRFFASMANRGQVWIDKERHAKLEAAEHDAQCVPELRERLKTQDVRLAKFEELIKLLDRYADHEWNCNLRNPKTSSGCSCGLVEVFARIGNNGF